MDNLIKEKKTAREQMTESRRKMFQVISHQSYDYQLLIGLLGATEDEKRGPLRYLHFLD